MQQQLRQGLCLFVFLPPLATRVHWNSLAALAGGLANRLAPTDTLAPVRLPAACLQPSTALLCRQLWVTR